MSQPEKFEHYELLKNEDGTLVELGHGAMGVTYKAFDTNLRCHVALKVITAAHLGDPTAAERFLREARGAAQLRHRNVASVFHLGRHADSYFYSMEFIEGETVDARVKRDGPVDCLTGLDIASQVAGALVAASKQGLIHRDIKPSNLMLIHEDDGELLVKVIDFGLVKSALISSTAGALTSSGFVGTPYFASPEQLDQRSEDIRSDIYSLGITLWFMLTGKPTFMGSVASVIAQHFDKTPAFESLAVLPTCVVDVLRQMLEKDVTTRIQTPQALRIELKRCMEILRASASSPATTMTYDEAYETIGLSNTHGLQARPRAGTVLNSRYRLIEDLDPSAPGTTFHAEDLHQRRRVRIRALQCDAATFTGLKEEIARLANAAPRNFTELLSAESTGSMSYVVSEWLEGFPLIDLLRARRELNFRETLTLLNQIAPTVDTARDLGVRVGLDLRNVFVHFPDGFGQLDEQVLLRCPIAEWPAFIVKLDPLDGLEQLDSPEADCEKTTIKSDERCRPAVIAQLASLTYDLLGGKPGASVPLANVSEIGNDAIRRGLRGRDDFPSAVAFVEALASSTPLDAAARSTAPTAPLSPITPPPQAPVSARTRDAAASTAPAAASHSSDSGSKSPLPWIAGLAGVLALVSLGAFFLTRGGSPTAAHPTPAPTPGATPLPTAPRQPPRPEQAWKNSLDMRYVWVGTVHFATVETRVRDFQAFVEATGYDATGGMYSLQKDGFKQYGHTWSNPGFPQSPEHPVVGVSYEDAAIFCDWLTKKERGEGALTGAQFYRLPTDREWSTAAGLPTEPGATPEERSGRVKGYAWGPGPLTDNVANFFGAEAAALARPDRPVIAGFRDDAIRTHIIAGYKPNALAIYDLGGNVWEWCLDRYNKTYPSWRTLRGGSWATFRPEELLLSYRRGYPSEFRQDDIGFRCVIATDDGER